MNYGITDLAGVLGITTSAIRYFEKERLISVEKEENGHRYYDEIDVFRLLSYMKYRSMEIPMKQIILQFSGMENDWKKIWERVEDAKEHALHRADYYRKLASAIDGHLQSIRLIGSLYGGFELAVSPTMVMVQDEEDGWMSRKRPVQEIIHSWVEKMPVVQLAVIKRDVQEKGGQRKSFGYIIAKECRELEKLPTGLKVLELESCLCVHTIVKEREQAVSHPQQFFEGACEYARSRALCKKGRRGDEFFW